MRSVTTGDDRWDEVTVATVVGRALGVRPEPWDRRDGTSVPDFRWTLPGGGTAALEVTRIIGGATAERDALVERQTLSWSALGARTWSVQVPAGIDMRALKAKARQVARLCEAAGRTSPDWLTGASARDPDVRWVLAHGVEMHAHDVPPGYEARTLLIAASTGGVVGGGLDLFAGELALLLERQGVAAHMDKLLAAAVDERHLGLLINPDAVSAAVYEVISTQYRTRPTPSEAPAIPAGIDGLWLVPEGGYSALWWRAHSWQRVPLERT